MSIVCERFRTCAPSATVAVNALTLELKRQGVAVIGLAAGEPDFDTPENIQQAAMAAMRGGKTRYAPPAGIVELREAICAKLARDNGLAYRPEDVSVGSGAKQSIFNVFMATLDPGDEVIVPAPYWVSFADIPSMMGGVPVAVPSSMENDFKLTPQALEASITPRSKWLVMCTPSNPTGAVYSDEELRALADVLRRHPGVWVLSDHIYEHLVFDGAPARTLTEVAPDFQQRSVIINGVSKANCMTGWRIGYVAGPTELIKAVNAIQSQATTSASTISQWAAVEALTGDQGYIAANNVQYRRRRDLVVARLNAIEGIACNLPRGAFYVYPSVAGLMGRSTPDGTVIASDVDLVSCLLKQALVAVVPGAAFSMSPHFRLAYSASYEELDEALTRIAEACAQLRPGR